MQFTAVLVGVFGLAALSSAFPTAGSNLPVCGAGKTAVCADNQECHKIYCSPRPGSRVCKCVPQGQEPEDPFVAWGLPRTPHHEEGLPYDVPKPHHVPKPSSTPKPSGYPKYHNTTKPMPKPHHGPKPTWIPENPMIWGPHERVPPPHSYLPYDKPEPHHLSDHPKPRPGPEPKESGKEEICAAFCYLDVKMPAGVCDCPAPKPQYPKSHHEPKPKLKTYEESPEHRDLLEEAICAVLCDSEKIPEAFRDKDRNSALIRCGCPVEMDGGEIYPLPHYPGDDLVQEDGKKRNDHYFD